MPVSTAAATMRKKEKYTKYCPKSTGGIRGCERLLA